MPNDKETRRRIKKHELEIARNHAHAESTFSAGPLTPRRIDIIFRDSQAVVRRNEDIAKLKSDLTSVV